MKLSILHIILWPKKETLDARVIEFKEDQINIITGQSMSGKSSITWIIDYCLGSSKCSIPVGVIRKKVEWFGLHIQLENSQLVIARRNPGIQQTTSDYFIHEAKTVDIAIRPFKNSRREDLLNRLNEIARLPLLDFSYIGEKEPYKARPSVRDLMAYCFLPQHIVANQYTLFYRTDTTEHRERFQSIFPLALGAIDAKSLSRQKELADCQRMLEREQKKLAAAKAAADAWLADLKGHYTKAQEFGLASIDVDVSSWSTDDYISHLRKVIQATPQAKVTHLPDGTIGRAAQELENLNKQEAYFSRELARLRRQLAHMAQLKNSTSEYQQDLHSQQDRLTGISWFQSKIGDQTTCMMCQSITTKPAAQLRSLSLLASTVTELATSITHVPPVIDKEREDLRRSADRYVEDLNAVRSQRKALEGSSKEAADARYTQGALFRFIGRLEQALETVEIAQPDASIGQSIARLTERIDHLKDGLDPQAVNRRRDTAINQVAARISHYAEKFNLERSSDLILVDSKELTLRFKSAGRDDLLFEIGSGQNYMGYHISTLCALHEFFVQRESNIVPQFLVIDQPSQVYFPEAWPSSTSDPRESVPVEKKEKVSADIEGVRRIFAVLSEFLQRSKRKVQVIVTEHAGDITWKDIPNIHLVGNWREGIEDFLIPKSWTDSE